MRDIRFRAWDKLKESIHDVAGINWIEGVVNLWKQTGSVRATYWAELDSVELVEFTGLKDKNEVEGYDGDLASKAGAIWMITWNENEGCWQLKNELYPPLPIRKLKEMIITGNIYENPELLEVK